MEAMIKNQEMRRSIRIAIDDKIANIHYLKTDKISERINEFDFDLTWDIEDWTSEFLRNFSMERSTK